MVDVLELDDANEEIDRRNAAGERQENGEPLRHAVGTQLLMGITKASLATDSFLSAGLLPGDHQGPDGGRHQGQGRSSGGA